MRYNACASIDGDAIATIRFKVEPCQVGSFAHVPDMGNTGALLLDVIGEIVCLPVRLRTCHTFLMPWTWPGCYWCGRG